MTGVEKHAQDILDRHRVGACECHCFYCAKKWPCSDVEAAEAVLVAARDHNTRQAKAIELIERIRDNSYEFDGCRDDAVDALDLLDKASNYWWTTDSRLIAHEEEGAWRVTVLRCGSSLLGGVVPTNTKEDS